MFKNEEFMHLHTHSDYSNKRLLDSINKITDMLECAARLGQKGLAITDHESLSGHIKFLLATEEFKKEGKLPKDFKPILGNEIYLVDEQEMKDKVEINERVSFYHFLLLAKDTEGHRLLRELSSRAWLRMFNYKGIERVPTFYSDIEELVGENKGHLIASTACLGSFFSRLVLSLLNEEDEDEQEFIKDEIDEFINWCVGIFGEDFYIELQPSKQYEQMEYNKMAIKIAKAYDLKWIITTDAHYISESDREIHKAFLTSEEDSNGNREVDDFYSTTHFFTTEKIYENMDYLNREDIELGVDNTYGIRNKISEYNLFKPTKIPLIKLPPQDEWFKFDTDVIKDYKNIEELFHGDEKYHRYLIHQIFSGINERNISQQEMDETLSRVDLECYEIIGASKAKEQPMGAYLVTMQKNIDIIWEEAESMVAPGRGSANGYIIDYLLGITHINPLKQGVEMPHWRFMSAERPDIFDIDIDYSSHKRNIVFDKIRDYYRSIGGDLVRVCTFGTETAKSAIQTACRGLGINSDVALYLSSLIPVERGSVWELSDCYYGNEDKGRDCVKEFKKIVDDYSSKNLLKVALGIEGLINKRSSHACGVLPVNEEFTLHNAYMRTPSGEIVSQYELHDSEMVSNLKYDFLNTKTCSMIQLTLEMLVKNKKMEWQGSLRKTYNKYLHPDVIDKTTPEMWEVLCNGKLLSAFQFESNVGEQAIKLIQPKTLLDVANGNTVMRLMVDSGEQPLEKFVRYKNNIQEWYKDMREFGLNEEMMKLMEKHLLQDYGICSSQEKMMLITMDSEVSGFGVIESNMLRKGTAKKNKKLIEKAKKMFFEWGRKRNTPQILLDYIWNVQIYMQLGYGFSILHSVAYSMILIQQLNLAYHYPSIYWNTAVLLVESGAVDMEYADESKNTGKEKTTNYGEVAKAIGKLQANGVNIALPNINEADQGFVPNEERQEILFGMKGIMSINNDTSQIILENRPFKSLQDFHTRMVMIKKEVIQSTGKKQMKSLVSSTQTITLIKAGAFDKLENEPREVILEKYIKLLNPSKKKLTTRDISKIDEYGIIPKVFKEELKYYNFREFIMQLEKIQDENTKTIKWVLVDCGEDTDYTVEFFMNNFSNDMQQDKDYKYNDYGTLMIATGTTRQGSFDSLYNSKIKPLTDWINTKECLDIYNSIVFEEIKNELMGGNISSWEMESMNFYYHEHELIKANMEKYNISDFNKIPESPNVVGFTKYKDLQYPKFELFNIIGTVLDRDKNKHSVSVLTPDGVVTVKFHAGQFTFYDKTISKDIGIDEKTGKNKKVTLEDGWFKRGNKLILTGYRNGDIFKPKRYKNSIYQHTVSKIVELKENGDLILQTERIAECDN